MQGSPNRHSTCFLPVGLCGGHGCCDAITQASAVRGQGGLSNLQRFIAHHPPIFTEGGDPVVADHWFRNVERILKAMEITSDATRIRLATFRLKGESQIWWDWVKVSQYPKTMT